MATTDQSASEKKVEVPRWCSVLPAAFLLGMVTSIIVGYVTELILPDRRLSVSLVGFVGAAAFIITGAIVAPRHRSVTATILAVLWVLFSVTIHLLVVGNRGPTNYMTVVGATVGAIGAIAFIWARERKACKKGSG